MAGMDAWPWVFIWPPSEAAKHAMDVHRPKLVSLVLGARAAAARNTRSSGITVAPVTEHAEQQPPLLYLIQRLQPHHTLVVVLQAVGGAAGNMICVHNVVAASATVGLTDREGDLIRKTLITMAYYVVQAGLIGMALIGGGLWWAAAVAWAAIVVGAMRASHGR